MKLQLFFAGLLLAVPAFSQVAIGTLSSAINATTLTVPYTQSAAALRPAATITIDAEQMTVCSSTSTQITLCSRGANFTAPASHSSGVTIYTSPHVLSEPPGVTPQAPQVSVADVRKQIAGR